MDSTSPPAYGLWSLVVINSFIFIIFAFSFAKPQSQRDWRSFGAFSGFLVALFTEMYGFPLTIYLLSGWLTTKFPGIDWLSHDAGHLLETLFGWSGNPHFGPFHLLSSAFLVGGFWVLASAWKELFAAQRTDRLATTGAYRYVRHPQYDGFVLIMFGLFVAVANAGDPGHVSNSGLHVLSFGEDRGDLDGGQIRRRVPALRRPDTGFFSQLGSARSKGGGLIRPDPRIVFANDV